jgi:hypothetical protein
MTEFHFQIHCHKLFPSCLKLKNLKEITKVCITELKNSWTERILKIPHVQVIWEK